MTTTPTHTFSCDHIEQRTSFGSKDELFMHIDTLVQEQNIVTSQDNIKHIIEEEYTTRGFGIGDHIAMINAKVKGLKEPFAGFVKLKKPLMLDAPDGEPCDFVGVIISPQKDAQIHLQKMARLSRLLKDKFTAEKIRETQSVSGLREILNGKPVDFKKAA